MELTPDQYKWLYEAGQESLRQAAIELEKRRLKLEQAKILLLKALLFMGDIEYESATLRKEIEEFLNE